MNDALDSFSQPIASTSKFPDALDPPSSQPSAQKPRHSSNKARLLWRGSLLSDTGVKLHGLFCGLLITIFKLKLDTGIAFVAEWPENKQSTSTRPPLLRHSSGHLPIDDPFISPERQAGLQLHTPAQCEADGNLTLGIEMLRHQDLHIQRSVELLQQSNIASTAVQVNKRKRGSLKSRIESLKKGNDRVVELADATYNPDGLSIRVYVDPRCSTSRDWFSKRFCDHMVRSSTCTETLN